MLQHTIILIIGEKWNQDPSKPRQVFATFGVSGDEPEDKDENESESDLEFDFTRLTFSAFDINLGFNPVEKLEQILGMSYLLLFIIFNSLQKEDMELIQT